jgi:hypothetical protein
MLAEKILKQLIIIDSLLRSKEFAFEMAHALHAVYGGGHHPFITVMEENELVEVSAKHEKVAINLAGFYALECGVGLLSEQTNHTPVEWLKKIASKTVDSNTLLLLGRFANATWKAGQPFRGLNRITRFNFTGAGYLPAEEVIKDHDQVTAAACLLLERMKDTAKYSFHDQMTRLQELLQDENFSYEIAEHLQAAYYRSQHQQPPLFMTEADNTTMISKSVREQKIATSIAGFYALECGINFLVTSRSLIPTDILTSILDNTIIEADKILLLRFANATWKAGQSFWNLKRITRSIFKPACFLTEDEVEKDLVQIKMAAFHLLAAMEDDKHPCRASVL